MKKFKVNLEYKYAQIELTFANTGDCSISEFGNNAVGENLLIIKSYNKDMVCSFILTSANKSGYIYKCVYNDWEVK